MKFLHLAAAIGMTALLGACATPWEVAEVNEILDAPAPTVGSPYTKALFTEYKAYAKHEATVEYEWDHAVVFARKGMAAHQGKITDPEVTADWPLMPDRVKELDAARARLVGYFGNGARERVPAAAAKAQVMFDCWIEEEAEGDTNSDCRAAFLKVEPELQVKAAMPAKKIVKTFIVYFDFNKSSLTKEAMKILKEVEAAAGEIKPSSIYVAGHTDTVGKAGYNDKLSKARAAAVEKQLAKQGIKSIDAKSFGFTKLAVPTKANTKEAKNRRVEIYFEK
ncbi:Putative outer membrane protein related peptidoglycan-associated (Lipo) protein [Magnetospirillum sp. XM-1]|uniref:OmpA family protein n=1 Tax=Magnetospirillum sp. XM-1 TaxID=1663591 RepID=UPI00073DD322|nr:OmpA family protein [Magnetospirillum sp. XM-1]CUW41332.1 Putative outer membrane protein related peptidoglycan-associated (Lipo) protein [Magnetospirillum sp. XM-1]